MLTPSQRKKVAGGALGYVPYFFRPELELNQLNELVQKVAQLIEAKFPDDELSWHQRNERRGRLSIALATNDTNALESLAYELLEAK